MTENQLICPLCQDKVDRLVYRFHYESENNILQRIRLHKPEWTENDGICSRCVDYFHTEIIREQRILPEIGPHFPIKSLDDFIILPTGLRLNTDPRYTGKGVTICFIDSGFYPHPDLMTPGSRIKKMFHIGDEPEASLPHPEAAWHGTMTTVVCAGNGALSKGLYKGIASEADLVLIGIQDKDGKIPGRNIVKALKWVLENHEQYEIRIVNLSLSDDDVSSYKESEVDRLAEELIENGVTVIAAVGNDEHAAIKAPANSLHVIAVGGVDDENKLDEPPSKLYHSAYGQTSDLLMKPELVAHAIWIAAPILPGTREEEEAGILHQLLALDDEHILYALKTIKGKIQCEAEIFQSVDVTYIRGCLLNRIQSGKYISPHYMHVDGTSFAAPIVSGIVAQLLEANPELHPLSIRETVFSTANRIPGVAVERQGFGIIQPRKALLRVLKRKKMLPTPDSPLINYKKKTIEFQLQNDCAGQVCLSGNFNHWAKDVLLMEPCLEGMWKIEIPLLPPGRYKYKFFIDNQMWMEDINNPYREPDGFSGFNSILVVDEEPQITPGPFDYKEKSKKEKIINPA